MLRVFNNDSDIAILKKMLAAEDIPCSETSFMDNPTFICENDNGKIIGFFTIGEEHGFPSIRHFCVSREYRSAVNARILAKEMVEVLKKIKPMKILAHAKKEYLQKIIEYYFKAKPYAVADDYNYYLIEV